MYTRKLDRGRERQSFRYQRANRENKHGHGLYVPTSKDYQDENGQWRTIYKRLSHMPALKLFHGSFINRKSPRAKMLLRELVLETHKDGSIKDSIRFGLKRAVKLAGSDKRFIGIDFDKASMLYEQSINGKNSKDRRYAKRALEKAEELWVKLNYKLYQNES